MKPQPAKNGLQWPYLTGRKIKELGALRCDEVCWNEGGLRPVTAQLKQQLKLTIENY